MMLTERKKRAGLIAAVLIAACATALFIISFSAETKMMAAALIFCLIVIFWAYAPMMYKIGLVLLSITFPITLQFMAQDAMTTGTILIFFLFGHVLISAPGLFRMKQFSLEQWLFLLLVIIAVLGFWMETPPAYYGPALRRLVNFVSGFLLFLVMTRALHIPRGGASPFDYMEKIVTIMVWTIALQVVISILFYVDPALQDFFSLFFRGEQTSILDTVPRDSRNFRAGTIFVGGETYGELLAVIFPLVLYKVFSSGKKYIYIIFVLLCLAGVVISATRSAALLVGFEIVVFYYFARSPALSTQRAVGAAVVFLLGVSVYSLYPEIAAVITVRFNDLFDQFTRSSISPEDYAEIMNRKEAWPMAWATTMNTLSLLGHGPVQPSRIGIAGAPTNFHCLYLTILFQFGIVGFVLFFWMIGRIFVKLTAVVRALPLSSRPFLLSAACLLSMFCFLVNEIKYEFNRSDSYQQFIWAVFGIYYLVGIYLNPDKPDGHLAHEPS